MADIIDSCCVNLQIKADKNNNTTANIDDGISLPSEQCDVLHNGTNDKSENTNCADAPCLSTKDDKNTTVTKAAITSSADVHDASINNELHVDTINPYKDFSGIDTESFITTTLRNNPKDRTLLLTLEKVFQEFIQNEEQTSYQFQAMNSYERMIVHRVAAFFGLDHNVDKNGQSIIVNKTTNTRIPNMSFQNFIPLDESSNGTAAIFNPPNENTTRRISRRTDKNPNKPFFERPIQYVETGERNPNSSSTKTNRKQQRFNTNHHPQQTNIQPTTHIINARTQPIYHQTFAPYYPQQQQLTDHSMKPQTTNSAVYNYIPMISSTALQHGNSMPVPILLQQPSGQIQYVFPAHNLQQAPPPPAPLPPAPVSIDGQYLPVYRSDVLPPIAENNTYSQPSFVHLYPTSSYPQTPQTTFIQPAPSFMIPPNNAPSIQYATNQLATLSLQSQYDGSRYPQSNVNSLKSFIQPSTNGLNRMPMHHQYRQSRPMTTTNIDKQLAPIENDVKLTMNNKPDPNSPLESAQEKKID